MSRPLSLGGGLWRAAAFTVLAFGVLSAAAIVNWRQNAGVREAADWVARTHEVSDQISATFSLIQDVQMAQRGYVIVGDPAYLQPYFEARDRLRTQLERVAELTRHTPLQQERVRKLHTMTEARIAFAEDIIAERDRNGPAAAAEMIRAGRGKQMMDEIRETIKAMAAEEDRHLAERVAAEDAASRNARLAVVACYVLSVSLLGLALYAAYRGYVQKLRAEQKAREHGQRYQDLFNHSPDAHLVVASSGVISEVNDEALKMFGYTRERLVGAMVEVLVPHRIQKKHAELRRTQTGHRTRLVGERPEMSALRADGTEFPVEVGLDLQPDGSSLVVVRDVSDRARLREAQALRQREQQYRELSESMPNLAWWANPDGHITWYNHRWYEYTGTTPADMEGWGWQSVHDPSMLPEVLERWRRTLATKEPFEMEFPLRGADGQFRWFLTRVIPVYDSAGALLRWFGTNTDITALRETRQELSAHKERLEKLVVELEAQKTQLNRAETTFRSTFENAAVGIAHVSPANRFVRVNNTLSSITGYPHDELVQKTFVDITHPDDLATDLGLLQRLSRREIDTYSMEKRYIRKDGSCVWIMLTASAVWSGENVEYFIAVIQDITQRRAAEHELADARKRLELHAQQLEMIVEQRTAELRQQREAAVSLARRVEATAAEVQDLYDNAPCGYHSLGADGTFVHINETELRWLGYSRQELLRGRLRFQDLLTPEGREAFAASFPSFVKTGAAHGLRFELSRKDKSRFWGEVSATAVRDANGNFVMSRSTVLDITDRKKAEDELARSNAELQQFAYVASHDLQEPLRGVAGCVQVLQHRYGNKLDNRADELIRLAVASAERMQQLIEDLLAYSRSGGASSQFIPVRAEDCVARALANLSSAVKQSGARVTTQPLATVVADGAQLSQVFQNLIANAIKYRGTASPEIEISAQHTGSMSQISVRDNGIGIEAQHFERIFGVFQRLHTRSEYPGTGIGLAICKKIIERHGGRIWLDSTVGSGSTFHFTLPSASTEQN